jgi:filamentous hemagglutinin
VKLPTGLSSTGGLALQNFVDAVIKGSEGATYFSGLADATTYSGDPLSGKITASFASDSTQLSAEEKARLELQLLYIVLRDTGRNHNKIGSSGFGTYTAGEEAIAAFFGSSAHSGSVTTFSRDIRTKNGGNINIFT